MTDRKASFFGFEDDALQRLLLDTLNRSGVSYGRARDGSVTFAERDRTAVMDAVCSVRDTRFPWYLLQCRTEDEYDRCRETLDAARLPYVVERQESGIWLLVRREDRPRHEELL
jgi:hypothetical protein